MKIPRNRLQISFSRSGGPGGQNVNKVETRVEVRFRVADADWIPPETKARLRKREHRRINVDGELVLHESRHRSQTRNLEECIEKLESLLDAANRRPRRRIPTAPTRASRERRLSAKRKLADKKRNRRVDRQE